MIFEDLRSLRLNLWNIWSFQIEVIWDESREAWQKLVMDTIKETTTSAWKPVYFLIFIIFLVIIWSQIVLLQNKLAKYF